MFRLTFTSPQVNIVRSSLKTKPQIMRVYKWGNNTGYYFPENSENWNNSWIAETRAHVESGPNYLLEGVAGLSCVAPPPSVDDIWTEDVCVRDNIIAGNLISIVGNAEQVNNYAVRHGITLRLAPAAVESDTPDTRLADPSRPPPLLESRSPPPPPQRSPHRS